MEEADWKLARKFEGWRVHGGSQRTGQGLEGGEVGRLSLAEDDGGGSILGGVGDGDGLASLDALGPGVELDGESSGDKGSARKNDLEETHF